MELGELLYNKSEYIETVRGFAHLPSASQDWVPLSLAGSRILSLPHPLWVPLALRHSLPSVASGVI